MPRKREVLTSLQEQKLLQRRRAAGGGPDFGPPRSKEPPKFIPLSSFRKFRELPAELQMMVFEFAFLNWMSLNDGPVLHHSYRAQSFRGSGFILPRRVPDFQYTVHGMQLPVPDFRIRNQDRDAIFCLHSPRQRFEPLQTCSAYRQATINMIKSQQWPMAFIGDYGKYKSQTFKERAKSEYTAQHRYHWLVKRRPVFLSESDELDVVEAPGLAGRRQHGPHTVGWNAKVARK